MYAVYSDVIFFVLGAGMYMEFALSDG